MYFAIAYTVEGYPAAVLSGLDAQGLADVIVYASQFGEVKDVSIHSY